MFDIVHRVGVKAPLDQVYRALATRDGVAGWWTTHTTGDSRAGGLLQTVFFTREGEKLGGFDLKVLELDPARRVLWQVADGPAEWVGTTIRFDLRQQGEFCVVLFAHEGWREAVEFMSHCSTKWATFLLSLKSFVESGRGAPSPNDVRIGDWH